MMSRTLRYLLVLGGSVVSILLFLLASAAENTDFFDKYYSLLIAVNIGSAVALLLLVSVLLTRLVKRYRQRKFGSRLMARLVFLFGIIGVLPGIVIYVVSVQFVSRSIESWFDIRVESALEAGLNLGRVTLQSSLDTLSNRANGLAQEMADSPESAQTMILSRLREPNIEASLLNENGQVIANYSNSASSYMAAPVSAAILKRARDPGGYAIIDSEDVNTSRKLANDTSNTQDHYASHLKLRVIVMVPRATSSMNLYKPNYFIQLTQDVPAYLASNAEALRAASSEYQERSLARSGLRKIYLVTLTLTLLLAIFGALAGAFLIANDLARPLLLLAEGTRAVTEGNLSPRPISTSNDELGLLTQSFNEMTRQLSDARASVDRNRLALQNTNAFLESVLGNMTAGVMVFDDQLKLMTINQSVQRILHVDLTANIGRTLDDQTVLKPLSDVLHKAMGVGAGAGRRRHDEQSQHWQQQIELQRSDEENSPEISVLARGSRLPIDGRNGMVVVFDDISDVISAHRSIAWGEVARRLAHEIKNPLTPIQLSAERLEHKLESQLATQEAKKLLKRSTETIVNQVAAMKQMVDDFRDYARTPPAVMGVVELNKLVGEILHLYLAGDGQDTIHPALAETLPMMMGDSTQLRQVIHNLLQNAQDAVHDPALRAGDQHVPRINIVTEQILTDEDMTGIRLSIIDNGAGFSPKILPRAFEPYVTSKARGTGLGLPMVKKIIEEHGGTISLHNRTDQRGARIDIVFTKLASELLISEHVAENRQSEQS